MHGLNALLNKLLNAQGKKKTPVIVIFPNRSSLQCNQKRSARIKSNYLYIQMCLCLRVLEAISNASQQCSALAIRQSRLNLTHAMAARGQRNESGSKLGDRKHDSPKLEGRKLAVESLIAKNLKAESFTIPSLMRSNLDQPAGIPIY